MVGGLARPRPVTRRTYGEPSATIPHFGRFHSVVFWPTPQATGITSSGTNSLPFKKAPRNFRASLARTPSALASLPGKGPYEVGMAMIPKFWFGTGLPLLTFPGAPPCWEGVRLCHCPGRISGGPSGYLALETRRIHPS